MALHEYLQESAAAWPEREAVCEAAGGTISYAELDRLSDLLRDRLVQMGVEPGDRVGLCVHKSIESVASIFGILKCGAAYVPVDSTAPATRNAYIFDNCSVKALIVEGALEPGLRSEFQKLGSIPQVIVLENLGAGGGLRSVLMRQVTPSAESVRRGSDDLAYILYTSGSTGKPKGVSISHGNAASFVQWCVETFEPTAQDRFSSHAPFHFDLSILDIYTAIKSGGALVLIGEEAGKEPTGLARLIADMKISVWYSAPSILSMMAQYGRLAEHDYSRLRMVLFAGEVFPLVHLRSFKKQVTHPRYFNLYGPTETNVCNYFEIPEEIPAERADPFPIGEVCKHLEGMVVDPGGAEVRAGSEGELCIRGPSVMQGYWKLPELSQKAFLEAQGSSWYRTGDIVLEESRGCYRFVGRRDRMVKKRGYRIELGEIEACLYRHPEVQEAAVVALVDDQAGVRVQAHIATVGNQKLGLIKIKHFCSEHLPLYMVPDEFSFHATLPKTSTDKIDYQTLKKAG